MNSLDAILEVAIGLVFVWLVLSAATMEAQNVFGRIFQLRANFLENAILDMFGGDKKIVDEFYKHPAIQKLHRKGFLKRIKRPEYIPNPIFAEAIFDVFVNLGLKEGEHRKDSVSLQAIINRVEELNDKDPALGYGLRRLLPNFDGEEIISKSRGFERSAGEIKKKAEAWFDASMATASFWYKEKAQALAFVFGFLIALVINIDTITIAQQLWRDPTMRQTLVAQAASIEVENTPIPVSGIEEYYKGINLPVGWTSELLPTANCSWVSVQNNYFVVKTSGGCYQISSLPRFNDFWGWTVKILGLLISAFAAMQGAPFWFDLLRKVLNIRGKSKGKDEDQEENPSPPPPPPVSPSMPFEPEAVG